MLCNENQVLDIEEKAKWLNKQDAVGLLGRGK